MLHRASHSARAVSGCETLLFVCAKIAQRICRSYHIDAIHAIGICIQEFNVQAETRQREAEVVTTTAVLCGLAVAAFFAPA